MLAIGAVAVAGCTPTDPTNRTVICGGQGLVCCVPAASALDGGVFDANEASASPLEARTDGGPITSACDPGLFCSQDDPNGPSRCASCPVGQPVACGGVCTNLAIDVGNCGACGVNCAFPTVTSPGCSVGVCTMGACVAGYADCDHDAANGCEAALATSAGNCGACGASCPSPAGGGAAACVGGVCTFSCSLPLVRCGSDCAPTCNQNPSCIRNVGDPPGPVAGCMDSPVPIPSGTFTMGGDPAGEDEGDPPYTRVPVAGSMTISAFLLDPTEVTVARFRNFWRAGHPPFATPLSYPGGMLTWTGGGVTEPLTTVSMDCTWSETQGPWEAHPLNCVDWNTAQAFCVWDGGRLPTEAEWEYAARGWTDNGMLPEGRFFPWGNAQPSGLLADWNYYSGVDSTGTVPVATFPMGMLGGFGGLYDMAGSVLEWVADAYAPYEDTTCWGGTSRTDPLCNPALESMDPNALGVVRGGAWNQDDPADLRSASRQQSELTFSPTINGRGTGFRCAR